MSLVEILQPDYTKESSTTPADQVHQIIAEIEQATLSSTDENSTPLDILERIVKNAMTLHSALLSTFARNRRLQPLGDPKTHNLLLQLLSHHGGLPDKGSVECNDSEDHSGPQDGQSTPEATKPTLWKSKPSKKSSKTRSKKRSDSKKEDTPDRPLQTAELYTPFSEKLPEDIVRTPLLLFKGWPGTPQEQWQRDLRYDQRLTAGHCQFLLNSSFHYCGQLDRFDPDSLVGMPPMIVVEGDKETLVHLRGTITLDVVNGKPVMLKDVWFYPEFKGVALSPHFLQDPTFRFTIDAQWKLLLVQSAQEIKEKIPETYFVVEIEESRVFIDFSRTYLVYHANSLD